MHALPNKLSLMKKNFFFYKKGKESSQVELPDGGSHKTKTSVCTGTLF